MSGGTTKTRVTQSPPAPEELEIMKRQTTLMDMMIEEYTRNQGLMEELFPETKEMIRAQTSAATALAQGKQAQMKSYLDLVPIMQQSFETAARPIEHEARTALPPATELPAMRQGAAPPPVTPGAPPPAMPPAGTTPAPRTSSTTPLVPTGPTSENDPLGIRR